MKIAGVAPNEVMLLDLAEHLSSAQSPSELKNAILDLASQARLLGYCSGQTAPLEERC
jgi:hypothetical protein